MNTETFNELKDNPVSLQGLFRGDEGKGSFVDFLVRKLEKTMVVRYSGFANASHAVVLPDGNHHCFSQFGSGTLAGAKTLLTKYGFLEPLALGNEEKALCNIGFKDSFKKLFIDENVVLITPFHIIANRINLSDNHGTTGMGINETAKMVHNNPELIIRVADVYKNGLADKFRNIQAWYINLYENNQAFDINIDDLVSQYAKVLDNVNIVASDVVSELVRNESLIFEGSQGLLLDEDFGLFPHVTWGKLSNRLPLEILAGSNKPQKLITVGLTRSYATMHGNCPFPTFDANLTYELKEKHNSSANFQGKFRCGWLDIPALRYACSISKINYLGISHMDTLTKFQQWKLCINYNLPIFNNLPSTIAEQKDNTLIYNVVVPEFTSIKNHDILKVVEKSLGIKVAIISSGATYKDKQFLL